MSRFYTLDSNGVPAVAYCVIRALDQAIEREKENA